MAFPADTRAKDAKPKAEKPTAEPVAAAVFVAIDSLVPWDQNPRNNDGAVPRVAESIREFGFGAPIVAQRSTNRVLAGHTRLKAAASLGLKEVPVRFLDLTDEQATRLTVADNKLGEIAEWDEEKLVEILRQSTLDSAMSMGFELKDLAKLMDSGAKDDAGLVGDMSVKFQILIECDSEEQQAELLERFEVDGLTCRALMV